MTVHRVIAEVGLSADEPFRKRRIGIVEYLLEGPMPIDEIGLLGPECIRFLDRTPVEFLIDRTHNVLYATPVVAQAPAKRRDESRRGRHECLRQGRPILEIEELKLHGDFVAGLE